MIISANSTFKYDYLKSIVYKKYRSIINTVCEIVNVSKQRYLSQLKINKNFLTLFLSFKQTEIK